MKKLFLTLFFLIIFQISCQSQTEDVKPVSEKIDLAIKSANEWLKNVDSSNYLKSWELSSELFKSAISKENWGKTLQQVRSPLGNVISREIQTKSYETSLPGAPDGEYVVIVYKTEFENKENSYETITPMKDNDGKWKVSGYYIK